MSKTGPIYKQQGRRWKKNEVGAYGGFGYQTPLKNENSSDLGLFKLKMSKMRRKKYNKQNKFKKIHQLLPQKALGHQNKPFRRAFMRMLDQQRGGLKPPKPPPDAAPGPH